MQVNQYAGAGYMFAREVVSGRYLTGRPLDAQAGY